MCIKSSIHLLLKFFSWHNIVFLLFFIFVFVVVVVVFETGFLCVALAVLEFTLCFVDQAGLQLRDPPASATVLGLKACATVLG